MKNSRKYIRNLQKMLKFHWDWIDQIKEQTVEMNIYIYIYNI